MFKEFYRDIDTLHQLVIPLEYGVYLTKLIDSMEEFKREFRESLIATEGANRSNVNFLGSFRLLLKEKK